VTALADWINDAQPPDQQQHHHSEDQLDGVGPPGRTRTPEITRIQELTSPS
jgi:hypothetical protein